MDQQSTRLNLKTTTVSGPVYFVCGFLVLRLVDGGINKLRSGDFDEHISNLKTFSACPDVS